MVYKIRKIDRQKGQNLFALMLEVFSVWTDLLASTEKEVFRPGKMCGTNELFHFEFRSWRDMGRLPSGTSRRIKALVRMGIPGINWFELVSHNIVLERAARLKKATGRIISAWPKKLIAI